MFVPSCTTVGYCAVVISSCHSHDEKLVLVLVLSDTEFFRVSYTAVMINRLHVLHFNLIADPSTLFTH